MTNLFSLRLFYTPAHSACDLCYKLAEVIDSVTFKMLRNALIEIKYPMEILRATNDGYNFAIYGGQ